MKIICISDTHGFHETLTLPKGDMLIHAGDVSLRGKKDQVVDFLEWYTQLDFEYKIFIAGNHDFFFERASTQEIDDIIPPDIIYLNDSGVVVKGLKIWGSPIQPRFLHWAFNRERGKEIRSHWEKIPNDVDILVTHGPASGILDFTTSQQSEGCRDLLDKIKEAKPKIHISGHIHEAYGRQKNFGVEFINASVLDESYVIRNPPLEVEIADKTKLKPPS